MDLNVPENMARGMVTVVVRSEPNSPRIGGQVGGVAMTTTGGEQGWGLRAAGRSK